ncbi:MAG: lmo0937 family membrane protein [Abditibacteriaceae bacterium]
MSLLMIIALVLAVLWILGFGVFHVAGALIHLIIVVAIILFVIGLLTRGKV